MFNSNNEIIDSFDGEKYELSRAFVEGMIDAGFGVSPKDKPPTIENNDIETLRFEYQEGYSFATEIESHFHSDVSSRLLIYVRDKKQVFESDYLFSLVATSNDMAEKIYKAINTHFSGFHASYQRFGLNNSKSWT